MATKRKAALDAVARLRGIVEKRLSALQAELDEQRENLSALDKERDLKAASMMAQTLGKVMELERRQRQAQDKRAKQRKLVNDARRLKLAQRIAALGQEPDDGTDQGEAGTAQPERTG
jgi:predicted nuclease with TOPRIM domain